MYRKLFPVAALALLAACSDDPVGPEQNDDATLSLDVMSAAVDATAEDVDVIAGMSGRLGTISFTPALFAPPEGPGNVNGCGFGGGRWNCPPNPANGLTITRSIAFLDALDAEQEAYDEETTASIDVEMTLEGGGSRGPWTTDVFRTRHVVWTGLEGDEEFRTANGEGTEEFSRQRDAGNAPQRSFEAEGEFTIEEVVVPVVEEGVDPWPLSGTITRTYTVIRNGGEPVTHVIIIEFDGTSTPPATLNGEPFEIDLEQRVAIRRL